MSRPACMQGSLAYVRLMLIWAFALQALIKESNDLLRITNKLLDAAAAAGRP